MSSPFSIVRGIVTNNEDPDKLGRVKVRLPFLGGKAKDNESLWCRVTRPVSHAQAGDWILPDVGDEVLVGYENNDLSRPIVMGSIYSETNSPPQIGREGDFNKDGKNTLRALKTKTGHTLLFDDTSGKEAIVIQDAGGHSITFDKNGIKVLTKKGELLELKDDQSVLLKCSKGHSVTMNESGVKIESKDGDKLEMKSSGITIQSAQKVTIAGSSKIELGEGASKSLVFGEDLMQAFNSHTHMYAATMSVGTTNPPMAPLTPGVLSKKVKTS